MSQAKQQAVPRVCRVCEQTITTPTRKSHCRERSPVDGGLCLGCWMGAVEMEKWLLRATGRSFWTLKVQKAMAALLAAMEKAS